MLKRGKNNKKENEDSVYHNPELIEDIKVIKEDNLMIEEDREEEQKECNRRYFFKCVKYFLDVFRGSFRG